jgi:hypothetical protein
MAFGYAYGDQAGSTIARPVCWGKDFSEGNAECRGCPFTATCKDHIIRLNMNRTAAPPYMQPVPVPLAVPQQPPPFYAAYPVQQAPAPVPQIPVYGKPPQPLVQTMPVRAAPPAQAQMVPQQAQQVLPQYSRPSPYIDWYGAVQDPLFYVVTTAPPLMRPQMQGESYAGRWIKNVGLSMLEAGLMHTFLAVRQLTLPPEPPQVTDQFKIPGQ